MPSYVTQFGHLIHQAYLVPKRADLCCVFLVIADINVQRSTYSRRHNAASSLRQIERNLYVLKTTENTIELI